MSNEDKIELQGIVTKISRGGTFDVEVNVSNNVKHLVLCKLSGKMRNNNIRIIIGDRVTLAVSPYDLNKGIIIWRDK
jgi:translation initiation factor IF-1